MKRNPTVIRTFDVDPGQNILERSGMEQITHFLLRLGFKTIRTLVRFSNNVEPLLSSTSEYFKYF